MSWLDFVRDNGISYQEASSGNIEVHCPFCGSSDRGKHMGLSLTNQFWGCWRNDRHRGTHAGFLIQAFLKCSESEANQLTRSYFRSTGFTKPKVKLDTKALSIPPEFHSFGHDPKMEIEFHNYLVSRHLDPSYVAPRFNLHWTIVGTYKNRIIIPVILNGFWYSWTGRTISTVNSMRYLAREDENTKPSDYLLDFDNLTGGDMLVVGEGAFDAIAITSSLIRGVHGTCLFGKTITPKQKKLLCHLSSKYERIFIALDRIEFPETVHMVNELSIYVPNLYALKPGGKDFGGMKRNQIKKELERVRTTV